VEGLLVPSQRLLLFSQTGLAPKESLPYAYETHPNQNRYVTTDNHVAHITRLAAIELGSDRGMMKRARITVKVG